MTATTTAADRAAMIEAALRVLLAPGQVTELRALNVTDADGRWPRTVAGYFTDHAKMAAAAVQLDTASGVYFTPNPCNPDLLARSNNRAQKAQKSGLTSDPDILTRRWFLVDLDFIRPGGISCTEEEHAAALERAGTVERALAADGWPAPISADSGNGGHLLYRVDLPAADDGLLMRALVALSARFTDDRVKVDTSVFNPSRIWKLYGTFARKGDSMPDRPHRLACLLSVPDPLEIVPRELLETLAASVPAEPPAGGNGKAAARPSTMPADALNVPAWITHHRLALTGPTDWNVKADAARGLAAAKAQRWEFLVCPWNPEHNRREAWLAQVTTGTAAGAMLAGCHHASCAWDWRDLRAKVETAAAAGTQDHEKPETLNPENPAPGGWQLQPDPPGGAVVRPIIEASEADLPANVDAAEEALLGSNGEPIYQRGGALVRAIRCPALTVRKGFTRPLGALTVVPLEAAHLRERFALAAQWNRWTVRGKPPKAELKPCGCPKDVALTYMARAGLWRVPNLVGIVEAPTLRPDGSLLTEPGYDDRSGLLFDAGGVYFEKIPADPPPEAVTAAAATFRDLLREFPFVEECDRAAAVAAICTALVRRSLPSAPMFAFRAPKMRSGKTMLADCVALIATGRPCAVMAQAKDEDEEKKRLLSVLMGGDSVVCYDNLDREFGFPALVAILTQETYKDRVLGFTRDVIVPTASTFLATGNNLLFVGEITCRVVPCDLDPEMEHPETRPFTRNLYEWIPQHRGRLVAAALTIMRGYLRAGRLEQPVPGWAGFDAWSRMVREAVVWAGFADPAAGRSRLEEADPVRSALAALLTAWEGYLPEMSYTVGDLDRESKPVGGGAPEPPDREALRAALLAVGGDRGDTLNGRKLGRYLLAHQKRIEAGLRVVKMTETRSGASLWTVQKVGKDKDA
jgi:hypothetical protein